MRIGQTSVVNFLSEVLSAVLGFAATLLVARALGPRGDDVLGVYFVIVAVVIWLRIIGGLGFQTAIKKRLSEGIEPGEYLTAGLLLQGLTLIIFSGLLLLLEPYLHSYLRGVPVVVVIGLLSATAGLKLVITVLDGLDLVHLSSILTPLDRLVRSAVQIVAILLGFSLFGLFAGYAAGAVIAALIGTFYIGPSPKMPKRRHLVDLLSYARYAWLTSISSRAFASLDTLVLALFVADGLIGVYEVAWNLASILAAFGGAIARSMFPAISSLSADAEASEVANLVADSVRYAGLLLIPGLVGAAIVGRDVLGIYGPAFTKGGFILLILVVARLLRTYQEQLTNALNAVDRPDLAFWAEGAFLVTNIVLNLLLVWWYGWVGAAVATATSSLVGLTAGYIIIQSIIPVSVPIRALSHQCIGAAVMGIIVIAGDSFLPNSPVATVGIVGAGALVYAGVVLMLSPPLREIVRRNLSVVT
jgi:O-antigen/teichoic acid export membrane protein